MLTLSKLTKDAYVILGDNQSLKDIDAILKFLLAKHYKTLVIDGAETSGWVIPKESVEYARVLLKFTDVSPNVKIQPCTSHDLPDDTITNQKMNEYVKCARYILDNERNDPECPWEHYTIAIDRAYPNGEEWDQAMKVLTFIYWVGGIKPKVYLPEALTQASKTTQKKQIAVDWTVDTSETYYIHTLACTTKALTSKLGKPTKVAGGKHRYEWKVTINGRVYSVYDWQNEDGKFEKFNECEWYVAGNKANKKDMETLEKFLGM